METSHITSSSNLTRSGQAQSNRISEESSRERRKPGLSFLVGFLAVFLWLFYWGYAKTLRVVEVNPWCRPKDLKPGENFIYLFWHAKTFFPLFVYRQAKPGILTLLDFKNLVYGQVCRFFGFQVVPVRSRSVATARLKELLESGSPIALAADGPAGPRGVLKPGAFYLAQKTQRPIAAIRVEAARSIRIRSRWDQFEIPIPFTQVTMTAGDPIWVTPENLDQARRQAELALGPA